MSTPVAKGEPKTIADWLALPDDARYELIDGELVEKAAPTFDHGTAQTLTAGTIAGAFHRRPGGPGGPGGWWIVTEVDIVLDGRGFRPDVSGWRRDRKPQLAGARSNAEGVAEVDRVLAPLKERPVTVRPDWICEIVSESNRAVDTVTKLRRYHQAGVPHYWIVDQFDRTLTVHRHAVEGYLVILRAEEHERVRAEPFDAIELEVRVLLGGDPA